MLAKLGSGTVSGVHAGSLPAATARWAARRHDSLIDPQLGRLTALLYVREGLILQSFAKPFLIDPDASALDSLGTDPALMDFYREFFLSSGILDRTAGTPLVGISVPMGPQLVPALLLAGLLKAAHQGQRIVLGGPTLSLMDTSDIDILVQHHPVDAIVRFDGEYPLLALARQAAGGRWDPGDAAGVSFLDGRTVQHTPPKPGPDPNRMPRPDYSPDLLARLAAPVLGITQARGCYWGKCDYCDFVELFDGSAPFRGRRPEGFVDELEHLVSEYGVTRFIFITESIPPAFARKMSSLLIERGLRISWYSFAMVDRRFDRGLLELMVQAGCDHLVIGMETTNTRVLKLVHKSADREENFRFLRDARAAGMRLRVNLIPDLPSTTYAEAVSALDDLHDLADCFDGVAVFPFEPTRSSNVGRTPERFGLLPLAGGADTGMAQYALNHLQSTDPAMTPAERADVHARYRAFQRQVNTRDGATPAQSRPAAGTARVRVPIEHLDVHLDGDRMICHHMGTLSRVMLPPVAARVLAPHLDGSAFTQASVAEWSDPIAAEVLITHLTEIGVLASADA